MKLLKAGIVCILNLASVSAYAEKAELVEYIDARSDEAWTAAHKIWTWAEPGYQETKSAGLLADMLEADGFRVTRGVANIPTAFTAEYGSGKPVIGILGEYDALPGLAQHANPEKAPIAGATYGHACGHHLFGVASAMAARAVAEQIRAGTMKGTVRFYGCPAEEGGSGKTFMTRDGLFDDCDAVLHWHPSSGNAAGDGSCLARIAVKFRFHGKSAHAAGAPEQGRSALDAVELTNYAAQLLREHVPEESRIHHVITHGGGAPNVVPDFAEVFFYVRHPEAKMVRELYARLLKCAEAGALATETELEVDFLGGTHNLLGNTVLSKVTHRNLEELIDLSLTKKEKAFANTVQQTLAKAKPLDTISEVTYTSGGVSKGSTDVGDVSWVAPTAGFRTACWVPGTPAHSWQAVAAGGMSIGHKGMVLAAKVLAASAWDIAQDPDIVRDAQAEWTERRDGQPYEALLEPNQPAPLDYRVNAE